MSFFLPKLYNDVDLSKKPEFLDKEMEQLSKKSRKCAKYVDKLVKVNLKDGNEKWILIHIEVQGYPDKNFSQRMFRYFYRIFDKHDTKIVSMAILTGLDTTSLESKYEIEAYGSHLLFEYPTFRLMDYDSEELDNSENPIAFVVLTSQEKARAEQRGDKFNTKLRLMRKMYTKGYDKEYIAGLLVFLDWSIQVNDEEDAIILKEIKKLEEVGKMPYVTSWERLAIKEGLKQGLEQGIELGSEKGALLNSREMILELLDERFGKVPSKISVILDTIGDKGELRKYHRLAVRCSSLDEFIKMLNGNS